jgi:hypothetical protein
VCEKGHTKVKFHFIQQKAGYISCKPLLLSNDDLELHRAFPSIHVRLPFEWHVHAEYDRLPQKNEMKKKKKRKLRECFS